MKVAIANEIPKNEKKSNFAPILFDFAKFE
jgi:hypothetical protein